MIELKEIQPRRYDVLYCNSVRLGEIIADVDGFLVFFPERERQGFWSEEVLIQLGLKLRELNAPWQKEINDFFIKARSV